MASFQKCKFGCLGANESFRSVCLNYELDWKTQGFEMFGWTYKKNFVFSTIISTKALHDCLQRTNNRNDVAVSTSALSLLCVRKFLKGMLL